MLFDRQALTWHTHRGVHCQLWQSCLQQDHLCCVQTGILTCTFSPARLRAQVASHWGKGVDKHSFADRIEFARQHRAQILASAAQPLGVAPSDRYSLQAVPCSTLVLALRKGCQSAQDVQIVRCLLPAPWSLAKQRGCGSCQGLA